MAQVRVRDDVEQPEDHLHGAGYRAASFTRLAPSAAVWGRAFHPAEATAAHVPAARNRVVHMLPLRSAVSGHDGTALMCRCRRGIVADGRGSAR